MKKLALVTKQEFELLCGVKFKLWKELYSCYY